MEKEYNWIVVWAYDINRNIGYDITMYQFKEIEPSYIFGLIEDKEKKLDYTTFKSKGLIYFDFKPFSIKYYASDEDIIISNCYTGFVGSRFIIGRFNASLI